MKKNVRIIKRTMPDGEVRFVIQEKFFCGLFGWWSDCWGEKDSYKTLEKAKKNLCRFDGTGVNEEKVY